MDANNQWHEHSEVFANSSELKTVKCSYLAGRVVLSLQVILVYACLELFVFKIKIMPFNPNFSHLLLSEGHAFKHQ